MIWDVFASVKFAAVIFAMIALTSIVGTLLEQNAAPEKNIKILTSLVGASAAPAAYSLFEKLGFMNMYHSWWFITFLLLFAANLVICSIDRLPRIMKLVKEPIRPLAPEMLEKMSIRRSITVKGKASGMKGTVADALGKLGFRPLESGEGGGTQFYAEKGNYTRLGVYITHLSILIILAGAVAGLFLGFNAYLSLAEGQTSSVAYTDARGASVPLGFDIRCDNFEVEYYGESDMPKAYKSWLTVIKNGQKVLQKAIVVNDPLTYEGITFYQSNFGSIPERAEEGILILKAVSREGKSEELNLRVGDTFTIPGTSVSGEIAEYSPALTYDQSGRPVTYADQLKNPAVHIKWHGLTGQMESWILKRFPQTWALPDGSSVEFLDVWGVEFTGMQVRKDPGVWIVYLGCIIMSVGLYITFFMSHRRIWVHISEEKGSSKIIIAASAHRNRASFERKIEHLAGLISSGTKGGK